MNEVGEHTKWTRHGNVDGTVSPWGRSEFLLNEDSYITSADSESNNSSYADQTTKSCQDGQKTESYIIPVKGNLTLSVLGGCVENNLLFSFSGGGFCWWPREVLIV
ncbi:hypothetical protein AMATHDRAFT_58663 [Amanita thiersii Skay4041]|uniref:Uncharacterized protein n=1 Tax=Amanita thiersii Skay4041 TaxID=703135 RepID=A0A2A9NUY4_9AGAR|nr:hypothetical protein AMATHDRAFT_58663 [Amanita thiersii Skay4041]